MKLKLVSNCDEFNLLDAFGLLQASDYSRYNPLDAMISQVEFRESILDVGVPHPKASMDRIYLLF